jgi:hypothetical protein
MIGLQTSETAERRVVYVSKIVHLDPHYYLKQFWLKSLPNDKFILEKILPATNWNDKTHVMQFYDADDKRILGAIILCKLTYDSYGTFIAVIFGVESGVALGEYHHFIQMHWRAQNL